MKEELINLCTKLASSCKEDVCDKCEYKTIDYPRCRGTYMAEQIIKEFPEGNK